MSRALRRAQDNLEDMLQAVEYNFSVIHGMLRNSMNPRRMELRRRIHEVNMEFIRIRANAMRQSFEQNLARLEVDRRKRRRRSDSVGSSYSDDEEYRFCPRYFTSRKSRRTRPPPDDSSANNQQTTEPTNEANSDQSKPTDGTATTSASPDSPTTSSSSSTTTGEFPSLVEQKLPISAEQIMPFQRSMATSTDDADFNQQF
ncbi:unnamed protein product [Caenorhabditis brenneri]